MRIGKKRNGFTVVELLVGLVALGVIVFCAGATIHGIILAFSASVLLGVAFLFLHPLPFITGVAYWIAGYNIPAEIMKLLN